MYMYIWRMSGNHCVLEVVGLWVKATHSSLYNPLRILLRKSKASENDRHIARLLCTLCAT